jgi:hypothetical protein
VREIRDAAENKGDTADLVFRNTQTAETDSQNRSDACRKKTKEANKKSKAKFGTLNSPTTLVRTGFQKKLAGKFELKSHNRGDDQPD